MMKKIMILGVLSSALMLPVMVNAGSTAQLKLIGTFTPAACALSFSDSGTINYGDKSFRALNVTTSTSLSPKETTLSISCDAATKFAFALKDEREGSAETSLVTIKGYEANQKFGLGYTSGSEKIGAYSLIMRTVRSDEGTANLLISQDKGRSWEEFSGSGLSSGSLIGFGRVGEGKAPSAHKTISVNVNVYAIINKTAAWKDKAAKINLDGLSTFELSYL